MTRRIVKDPVFGTLHEVKEPSLIWLGLRTIEEIVMFGVLIWVIIECNQTRIALQKIEIVIQKGDSK